MPVGYESFCLFEPTDTLNGTESSDLDKCQAAMGACSQQLAAERKTGKRRPYPT